MENTQEQNETLKPEQMESGKWYVVDTFLIKFKKITDNCIYRYKCYELETKTNFSGNPNGYISTENNLIRPATKDEVLKYFPDEVFEPIELRPEDLVSGEVYTLVNTEYDRRFTFIHKHYDSDSANPILYTKMYAHHLKEFHYNSCFSLRLIKIYHATPEEKKLLLGEEEPTDWEAKYNELKAKFDALTDSHSRLEFYDKELENVVHEQAKLIKRLQNNQLEPKGEKVYFYFDNDLERNLITSNLEDAVSNSKENQAIYEGYCIGKKKSVLVNE